VPAFLRGIIKYVSTPFCRCLRILVLLAGPIYGQEDSVESLEDSTQYVRISPFKDTAYLAGKAREQLANLILDSTLRSEPDLKAISIPFYEAWQNPWYIYSDRYQQFVDVLKPSDLMASHTIALTHRPGNQPYEQGLVYFPGPTCIYLDGRFLAYINKQTVDLNKLRPNFVKYAAFYMNPSYQQLVARSAGPKVATVPRDGKPPFRQHRDSLLAGSFTLLLALLLGSRGRAFYRIFSLRSLLLQPEQALPGQGPEVIGWQTAVHISLSVLCTGMFLYCYRYGIDPVLLQKGGQNGWMNLTAFTELAVGTGGYLILLELYVFITGMALFNIRIEGSHVRGNLEVFSIGSVLLAVWALFWNFTNLIDFETFRFVSFYFCLILFGIKGFLMYKILISDQGFRKFYALSYICLTELLPSILLIRMLTDL
jgi:hypothetical protein